VGDQSLEGEGAACQERERGADVPRRVVERADEAHLLVVDAVRVDGDACVPRETAERQHGAPRPHQRERPLPGVDRAGRLDCDVHAVGIAADRAERGGECAALLARADPDRTSAGVGHAGAEHQPDRAEADDRDVLSVLDPGHVDAVEAAGERLRQRRHLGGEAGRHGEEIPRGDPLRHEEQLGIRAVQQRKEVLAQRLLTAAARGASTARGRVGCDDPPACRDVDPADLVPERARQRAEQHRMPAAVRLEVGPVGQRDLDLQQDVSFSGNRVRDVLEPEVAGAVQDQRPHETKTTFAASRRRYSSRPSANRASGSTVGSETSRSWRSATASGM
jgi:hypothetical protein